jgi:hypothetical protein
VLLFYINGVYKLFNWGIHSKPVHLVLELDFEGSKFIGFSFGALDFLRFDSEDSAVLGSFPFQFCHAKVAKSLQKIPQCCFVFCIAYHVCYYGK